MTKKDNSNLIIVLVAVIAILVFLGIFRSNFTGYGMMGGYNMMDGYNNGFTSFIGVFSSIVIAALVIVLASVGIYWLIKNIDAKEKNNS